MGVLQDEIKEDVGAIPRCKKCGSERVAKDACVSDQGIGFRVIVRPGVIITPPHRSPKPPLELGAALNQRRENEHADPFPINARPHFTQFVPQEPL